MKHMVPQAFFTFSLGITKCFLIPCEGGFLLVDTSIPNTYKKFIKELNKLSVKVSQVKYVFLTHHHDDHTGFLKRLIEESRATLIVHRKALSFLAEGVNNSEMTGNSALIRLLMRLKLTLGLTRVNEAVVPDDKAIILEADNNELLRSIGIPAKIISLPGHTGDSIAVVFDDGRALVGDAAMNLCRLLNPGYYPLVAEDCLQIKTSWIKLLNQGAKELFVSHGKPISVHRLIKH